MPPEERKRNSDSSHASPWQDREREGSSPWAIVLFGLVGATATTVAVTRLRTTVDWFYNQLRRSQPFSSWTSTSGSSSRRSFREEARSRYNRRMQEEYEDEMERVERIRRMQSVFNRERSKHKKTYESWREQGPTAYQNFQREDWYWKSDRSYTDQRTNFRPPPRDGGNYAMSHHYSILGLDRCRAKPYSETEIKTAFRAKAMEYHPDQNQNNKEFAEAKFKEVMTSYDAIKLERKNGKT
ncbi:uncharacterized protein M6B38_295070 [Iris pallida]|uniref:J domain-containing protein n=1 Tax=Iris pallida TaxID=29817 RepID=A0AAX6HSA7_IRIPA|nr:uncharacterized protein M6B38_295070 [Iris pallida]